MAEATAFRLVPGKTVSRTPQLPLSRSSRKTVSRSSRKTPDPPQASSPSHPIYFPFTSRWLGGNSGGGEQEAGRLGLGARQTGVGTFALTAKMEWQASPPFIPPTPPRHSPHQLRPAIYPTRPVPACHSGVGVLTPGVPESRRSNQNNLTSKSGSTQTQSASTPSEGYSRQVWIRFTPPANKLSGEDPDGPPALKHLRPE